MPPITPWLSPLEPACQHAPRARILLVVPNKRFAKSVDRQWDVEFFAQVCEVPEESRCVRMVGADGHFTDVNVNVMPVSHLTDFLE